MKYLSIMLLTLGFTLCLLFTPSPVKAQSDNLVHCARGDTQCDYNYGMQSVCDQCWIQCITGYQPPCNVAGCNACTYYGSIHNDQCPTTIPCIPVGATVAPPPTPTGPAPTPDMICRNSPAYQQGGCFYDSDCAKWGSNITCDTSNHKFQPDCLGVCVGTNTGQPVVTPTPVSTQVCDFAGTNKSDCNDCTNGTGKYSGQGPGAWTALGCIPTDPSLFIGQILGIAVGIGGGIAFLLILFGGFQILMSAGNPERLNAGKELVTSAITGLLIIIFSLFILRLIGFTILGIPGFG